MHTLVLRKALRRFPALSYRTRLHAGAVERPFYAWPLYYAAVEAKALGHSAMTVVEFGVAGGNGLLCLCRHKAEIENLVGTKIEVVGFDTGAGLPASNDPRDLLYCWPTGSFEMDRAELERRLAGQAQLVVGDVSETVAAWEPRADAPLGTVMFDLDYYSSTRAALEIFSKQNVLPRVWSYLDDIIGRPDNAYTDGIGVRAAVKEFNSQAERALLNDHFGPVYAFQSEKPEAWHQQIYVYHRLSHPDYNRCLSDHKHQLVLDESQLS